MRREMGCEENCLPGLAWSLEEENTLEKGRGGRWGSPGWPGCQSGGVMPARYATT
jgi:hypothetical protein